MTSHHLSDAGIQEYVLHRENCTAEILGHMQACGQCRIKADNYRLIFTALELAPAPVPDVDMSELILAQLPAGGRRIKKDRALAYLLIAAGVVTVVPCWLLRRSFLSVLENVPALPLYLILAVGLAVTLSRAFSMVKRYQHRMKMLNFS